MLQGPYTFTPTTQSWGVHLLLKVGHHGSSSGYFVSGGFEHFAFQTPINTIVYESLFTSAFIWLLERALRKAEMAGSLLGSAC